MPTILRTDGYRFFFYSNEADPREPVHIHIMQGRAEAKSWLEPEMRLARSHGFNARTLRKLASMVERHSGTITRGWHGHFSN